MHQNLILCWILLIVGLACVRGQDADGTGGSASADSRHHSPHELRPTPDLWKAAQARIDVLMVAVPLKVGVEFVRRSRSEEGTNDLQNVLVGLIERKGAAFLGWPEVTLHDGRRATVECIHEDRYPSEFEPPTEATLGMAPRPPLPRQILNAVRFAGHGPPVSYESRNIGITLEVGAQRSGDGGSWRLWFGVSHLRNARSELIPVLPALAGFTMPQPRFVRHQVSGSVSIADREQRLILVGRDSEDWGRMVLFVLGMHAIR